MKRYLKLEGAKVFDPVNQIDGVVADLWVCEGKIVPAPDSSSNHHGISIERIDLAGHVIMPGGIDMHCHIAGGKVNSARLLRLDEKDYSPSWWEGSSEFSLAKRLHQKSPVSLPSTLETGYRYALLGYTTAFDAAVSPRLARQTHLELGDTPCIDKGFYTLLGNNVPLLKSIAAKKESDVDRYLAWIIDAVKSYAPKLVNPGGVENWKQFGTDIRSLDQKVAGIETTPSQILAEVTAAASRLGLPHPVHVHCNGLGLPGNWELTKQSFQLLAGQQAHFTHIQFHSYDGKEADEGSFGSRVPELASFINSQPKLSVDVGQVLFGKTTSLTGDGPASQFLSRLYGKQWINHDTELESGCGIIPIEYKNRSRIHAWQWAIGLQWYLLVDNPWQVVMSTDHPNGGSFTAYPQIIRLLMDGEYRREQVSLLPQDIQEQTGLLEIEREYSLQEIAVITRSGPAKLLGLSQKGHLGVGADADLTVYLPDENQQKMFQMPKHVIKSGRFVIRDFEFADIPPGELLHAELNIDSQQQLELDQMIEKEYSIPSHEYRIW